VTEQPSLSFAGLLRQLRGDAKLTQGELARAAGLSPRAISDLERGINRTARKNTGRATGRSPRPWSLARGIRIPAIQPANPASGDNRQEQPPR